MGWNSITWHSRQGDMHTLAHVGQFLLLRPWFRAAGKRPCSGRGPSSRMFSFLRSFSTDESRGCQFHPERSGLAGVRFLGRLLAFLHSGASSSLKTSFPRGKGASEQHDRTRRADMIVYPAIDSTNTR
jgi:hypothetical protein